MSHVSSRNNTTSILSKTTSDPNIVQIRIRDGNYIIFATMQILTDMTSNINNAR